MYDVRVTTTTATETLSTEMETARKAMQDAQATCKAIDARLLAELGEIEFDAAPLTDEQIDAHAAFIAAQRAYQQAVDAWSETQTGPAEDHIMRAVKSTIDR